MTTILRPGPAGKTKETILPRENMIISWPVGTTLTGPAAGREVPGSAFKPIVVKWKGWPAKMNVICEVRVIGLVMDRPNDASQG